jgi:histidinol dehydrogenase
LKKQVYKFLETLETAAIASLAIEKSFMIIVDDIKESIEIANKKAPEHLEVCVQNEEEIIPKLKNYGSLFIGNYSAEVLGDYCSGTNHVLPTNSISKYTGGLSVFDFIKIQTYQKISEQAAKNDLCPTASKLAQTEGLYAHKLSSDVRMTS